MHKGFSRSLEKESFLLMKQMTTGASAPMSTETKLD